MSGMIPSSIPGWEALNGELSKPHMRALDTCLCAQEKAGVVIYPPANFGSQPAEHSIFKAFCLTPLSEVRVVILGKDPYFRKGEATGLAFGLPEGVMRPSLRNIDHEILRDTKHARTAKSDLVAWAEQGVLFLNTFLTVQDGLAGSHRHLGWEEFTDRVVELVAKEPRDIVFCLWGTEARRKKNILLDTKVKANYILEASHPSRPDTGHQPFSNCKHFSKVKALLRGKQIRW